MQTSEQINELAAALAKAQGKITGAIKDSANPFFKSKYADLASVWDAVRDHLAANGLSVIQSASTTEGGGICVTAMLAHSSGQWVRDTLTLTPKDQSPQAMGSTITYGRRYLLAALTGAAQIDDDGNAASGKGTVDPRGDALEHADPAKAKQLAEEMKTALALDAEETDIATAVYALHSRIADNDLYIAASAQLDSKLRAAWKTYVKQGKAHPVSPNGRAM
jgi:hypothetical protein